jgi:shikimate dehydrogenase
MDMAHPDRLVTHSLALVGEGIGKSLTPAMHEREGRELGMSVTYRIVDALELGLGPDDLPDLLRWARRFGMTGLNITHPFKKAVIPHLDALSDRATALGAVNTVVNRDGMLVGHNTDWCGFARPLEHTYPGAAKGRTVLIGAGGAGAAAAYALLDLGTSHLTVLDEFPGPRDQLVERMSGLFGPDRICAGEDLAVALSTADGLVHATPTGMATHPGCAVPDDLLRPDLWVAEIVYMPLETELLRRARAKGCRTIDGGGMAAEQAAEAFYLFTGRRADSDRVHAHLRAMVSAA